MTVKLRCVNASVGRSPNKKVPACLLQVGEVYESPDWDVAPPGMVKVNNRFYRRDRFEEV